MHQQDETAEYERLYADRSSGEKSDGSFDDEEDSKLALPRGRSWWLSWRGWILHLGLPLVYTVIFIEAMSHVWRGDGGMFSLVESPAKYIGKKTHLEVFPLDKFLEGPYTGQPGPELDEVWGDLLQYNNMRIPDEMVQTLGREYQGVKLPDGGYLGVLSVFHELHCIKRVFRTIHSDYYFPNATAEMRKEFTEHAEHCLELFRMSAMCRGDVSVLTHRWVDGDLLPHVNQSSPHQCVDWSQVMDFAESASVDVFRKDYIINPETGKRCPAPYHRKHC
ncbi:hypothetical protein BKA67DRAFT_528553 [Truncatella angustata]|uniref:Cyclochlorotine biosynthesis protein O n=1 Tax=Truncatella angustata TaxID=152316 RepID=A0A9P8REK3_9PEZI|nr:uncharacterized protein BKA67DRAFT_528553 [Truncatella angustata]KAH6640028.1 hypothetical protein BKA67DRAFT_528553 [Truncatella angustata]